MPKVIENFETNLNHENFDIGKEYPLPSRNGMTFAFKAHWVNHPSETFEYPDEPPFLGIVDDRSDAEVHDDCSKARAERKMAYLEMKIEVGNVVEFNRERFMKNPPPAGQDYCDRHRIGKVTAVIDEHVNVEVFKNSISDEKDRYQVRKGEIVGICK